MPGEEPQSRGSLGEGGSPLDDAAALLARAVGLRLDATMRGRVHRAVSDEAEERGRTPEEYVALLRTDPATFQDLLDRVTVQESAFFREPAQFEALATRVLPALADPVTIWSAGCANGQEPYSLAMVLDEAGRARASVIATDVSTQALERARAARYDERELRGLSAARQVRYMKADGDRWEIVPWLRERVTVIPHNFVAAPPPFEPGRCQVVFCRNVLIYCAREEVIAFLERLARWLPPGGYLFLGSSESIWHVSDRFRLEQLAGAYAYRLPPAGQPAGARRTAGRPGPTARAGRREPVPRRGEAAGPALPGAPDEALPQVADLLARGEAAASRGDHGAAASAFRSAVYLDPDDPIAHFYLGLSLEAAGDARAARRAYAAARAALDRGGDAVVEAALEGYRVEELTSLIDGKLRG